MSFVTRSMPEDAAETEERDDDRLFETPKAVTCSTEGPLTDDASAQSDDDDRGHWGAGVEFFLSCVGYSVGIGNLWRFPYICMRNGGGAFLIPFFIFLFLCGMPLFMLELVIGQFSNLSPITVWAFCPLLRGVGIGMCIISAIVGIYFNVIMAWALFFFWESFTTGPLPWASCDNAWNTENCAVRVKTFGSNFSVNATLDGYNNVTINTTTLQEKVSPAEEFFRRYILDVSESADDWGGIRWPLFGFLALAWFLVFLTMVRGVKTSGKVVYVTATLPFVLLIILLIRGLTLPGAFNGLTYFFAVDKDKLFSVKTWMEACLQIFFSLGPAWGGLITMASYNKFNYNCYRDAILVSCIDAGSCVLGGCVIFSILGFMAHNLGKTIDDVVMSGPGLVFVAYPEIVTHLPWAPFWSVCFFLMALTLGIDSQFGMFETCVSGLLDISPTLRRHKILTTASVAIVFFILGIFFITRAGYYMFEVIDWYCAAFCVTMMAFTETMVLSWVYGCQRLFDDVELMVGRQPMIIWKLLWQYISPLLLLTIIIFTMVGLTEPTYDDKTPYPTWLIAAGWISSIAALVPLPIMAVIVLIRTPGATIVERFLRSVKPSADWRPADEKLQHAYYVKYKYGPHQDGLDSTTDKLKMDEV